MLNLLTTIQQKFKKMLCKKHRVAFSTKEKAQILMDNLRMPVYKRKIKKCLGCGKYYVQSKYYGAIK